MPGLVLALLMFSLTAQAETVTGRIIGVADGDTLTLLDATNLPHKIGLSGADAPEAAQDFGQNARTGLSALALNQPATADCRKVDRYRREICVVHARGRDLGLEQIRLGMAWWYHDDAQEQTAQERADYSQAEFTAKIRRAGLWSGKNPMPPWEWRRRTGE